VKLCLRSSAVRALLAFTFATTAVPGVGRASVDDDFESLKDSGVDYTVTGTVCEEVARLRLQQTYPAPVYDVLTGIEYRIGGRTVGELDVVVFDGNDEVIMVSEVKCRNRFGAAASKAREQLERFQDSLASGQPMKLTLKSDPARPFERAQFLGCTDYLKISQRGGVGAGFDLDIGLTLDEAMALRQRLMSCQRDGDCTAPRRP
jgi:hypothetical protein